MERKKILVVEDRENTRKVIAAILSDEGFDVLTAPDGRKALGIFSVHYDITAVLSDLKMPGMNGLELFHRMNGIRKPPPFIIMTAYGTVKSAVSALKEGVANYLIKPLDYEELTIVLDKAIREHDMSSELSALKKQLIGDNIFHGVIGADPKMQVIFQLVRTVGPTDASVVIYGETGTGKELLANALHRESPRRQRPMVCINSASLSEHLLEAELFGYLKGAFTGAITNRKGRLETAHHSTLFLDEIGHMSMNLQAKLLRFLEEKTFEPVGDTDSRKVDVRVIAATNVDLQEEIRKERFLGDLLYRLEVVPIHVPPLKERRGDVCHLTDHFMRQFSLQYDKKLTGVSSGAMDLLSAYPWPGNVRELKNTIQQVVILSGNSILEVDDLPGKIKAGISHDCPGEMMTSGSAAGDMAISLREMEIDLIQATLERCNGNKSHAAQQLGISRKTLYEKINRYHIPVAKPAR
ncbi:MAG: sigma-54-dependent Fis family transcriptional regulator [Desulfobacteraceae bacterium]|nr:sigma-54-dependent Fis family transcriptional regulator [Desulfobacteraceae bacterium]